MAHTIPVLPDAQVEPLANAYRKSLRQRSGFGVFGFLLLIAAIALSCWVTQIDPAKLIEHSDHFTSYFWRLAHLDNGRFVWTDLSEWYWGIKRWLRLLGETLLIAYLATAVGIIGGSALSFLAATSTRTGPIVQSLVRRFLEIERTIPSMIFALIFVAAFGLGAMPGVFAIAIHSMGALGKLYYEIVENIDPKPVEGIRAAGGSWISAMRFGALPQVLPSFASYGLARFEINVRDASVIGLVGAGGIGQDLFEAIQKFYYADVSAILILIILTVTLIDLGTERIRHRLQGEETRG